MSKRHQILMCPPDHFAVNYSINPWMEGEVGDVSVERAKAQWNALRDVLAKFAEVKLLEPAPGLPDMVFTANAGVVYGRRAIISRFGFEERRGEEAHFRNWFEANGFEAVDWPEELVFEGAGDCLLDRGGDWVWSGYGQRSEDAAQAELTKFYPDRELVSMRLVDSHYYHIDTCLQPLEGGHLLYFPEAFDDADRAEIERLIPADKRIPVTADEAANFACNAVNLNDQVVLNAPSERLRTALEAAGYAVTSVNLSEFLKSGGSAKCLVLRLDEP
jgi:N-dimethylarginine dimethylaminohydrolase